MTNTKLDHRSEDFRAGVAYAAGLLRNAVNEATVTVAEPRHCCRDAVTGMALGMAEGMEDAAGMTDPSWGRDQR